MSVATDYCTPTRIDSYTKIGDTSAECFYYFPVKSVETACDKLLKQDSSRTRYRALADRATAKMARIKTKITHLWKSESIKRNLKIAAYIAAAIAVFILINAVTVGLLAPLVLLGGVGVVLLIELGIMLFPISIALSIFAAYKIGKNINNLPRPITPTVREENTNTHLDNVHIRLLDGIKELHKKLLTIAKKKVRNLSQEDISIIFHMIKEVEDLSILVPSGNEDYEKATKRLSQYLQKNAKVRFEDKKTLLDKIKDHAFMKDKKRLEYLVNTLNRRTHNDEGIPLDYLDEITDIVMAYMDEENIHPDIEALVVELQPMLLKQLDKENSALLKQFTEETTFVDLNEDNMITFTTTPDTEDSLHTINLYDLVDKLHTIEKLHLLTPYNRQRPTPTEDDISVQNSLADPASNSLQPTTSGNNGSEYTDFPKQNEPVQDDTATDGSVCVIASPVSVLENKYDFSKTNRTYKQLRKQLLLITRFDRQAEPDDDDAQLLTEAGGNITKTKETVKDGIVEPTSPLADVVHDQPDGNNQAASGCEKAKRTWAMRPLTRRIKHFWENRKYPVKLDTVDTNEDTYDSSLKCVPLDTVAPTLETADNIVLLLKDGRIYARDELTEWARLKQCKTGLLISPFNRETAHVLDMCPLPAMIPVKAFTLEAFLPQALPQHAIMQP